MKAKGRLSILTGSLFLQALLFNTSYGMSADSNTQWQQVPIATKALRYYLESKGISPAGGEGMQFIHALAYAPSNPNIAYLGIDTDTIWKSTDGGTTWQRKSKGIASNGIVSITVDPINEKRVFVTGANYDGFWANLADQSKSPLGIYRTLDGGENWQLVKQTDYGKPGNYARFGANLIAFAGNTIYAGTEKDGLLKSIDGGDTWTTVVAYATIGRIFDVDAHPTDNSIIYVSSINGLRKVTSSGVVTSIGSGLTGPAVPLLINPNNPLIMFAGDDSNKIMKSIDGGFTFTASFTHSNTAQSTAWMAMSPVDPNYVFVSFGQRNWAEPQKDFYYTQNASASSVTWQTAQSMDEKNQYGWVAGSLDGDWPNSDSWGEFYGGPIAMHPTNKNIALYFAGPGVIKKTTDGGANWRYSNAGYTTLGGSHNRSLLSFDKNKARGIGISSTDRGLYFSDDNGYTFSTFKLPSYPVAPNNRGFGVAVGWGSTEDVIVGAVGSPTEQILTVSKDKGNTWMQITTPNTAGNWEGKFITFSPTNSSVIYAGSLRSIDGGTSWTQLSLSVSGVYSGNGDIVYSIRPGVIGGSSTISIYKSINRGSTWTSPYPEIPTSFGNVMGIAVSPTNPDKIYFGRRGIGVYIINGSATPVLKNWNNGLLKDQWGTFNFSSIAIDPNNSNVVYVGNSAIGGHDDKTIFRSTDGGATWETINFNLNNFGINGVVVNPIDSYVYVGTWGGIWKLPPPGDVVSDNSAAPQGTISINANASYTNTTTVSLTLGATDSVGVTGYYLSTSTLNPSASASDWTTVTSNTSYSATVPYTLITTDGVKTLYCWYKDAAGNISTSSTDAITLDSTAPTVTITSPTTSATYATTTNTLNLSGTASDAGSGLSAITYILNSGVPVLAAGTTTWSIAGVSLASGANTITVTAKDAANNTSTDTMTVTHTASGNPAPVITSALSSTGTVATALSYQITAANSPTSFNAAGLPTGLSVNTVTGLISGTPTTAGTSSVTISAANASGTGSANLAWRVYSACDLNRDWSTNVVDVQLQVNAALGVTACASDLNRDGSCNVIDVQRNVNASLGGGCLLGP
ncbi:MAG: putative Ig domain-containing protein [Elusimicrobiota bacterium]